MIWRVVLKAAVLVVLFNVLAAQFSPTWQRLTLYGVVFPARSRLPYAENPSESYNVTLASLSAMLAAHQITHTKAPHEYRVLLLGDSAVWGWLLAHDQTLSACLNALNLQTPAGQTIRAYNLGYPVLDVTKDLLILQQGLDYAPDMVLWFITLAALYPDEQLFHPIVRQHPTEVRALIQQYDLALDPRELPAAPNFWGRSLIGGRRAAAAWLRHQVYGVAWMMTGIDHRNPRFFQPVQRHLRAGTAMLDGTQEKIWSRSDLSLDVLAAGVQMAEDIPVIFINEPIYISDGLNSDLRYNFYYPRWAYDGYRDLLQSEAATQGWHYLDFWDAAPADEFTDSSLHLSPRATCDFAALIGTELQKAIP